MTTSPADSGDQGRGGGATAGALHIVSTPIGNLADLSARAAAVLREVSTVVAEDTRVTRTLLQSIGVSVPLVALPAFDEIERIHPIIQRLKQGEAVAFVTDAGTPLVSDPGARLVAAAIAEGIRVIPIPGASALLAGLVASGLASARWSFEGFLPRGGSERAAAIEAIAADSRTTIIYEAGNRVAETLANLASACGSDRPAAVCRELTKLHEEVRRGTLESLADAMAAGSIDERGEFVIVVEGAPELHVDTADDPDGPYAAALVVVERCVASGESRSRAVRRIALLWRIDRRRLWAAAHGGEGDAAVD